MENLSQREPVWGAFWPNIAFIFALAAGILTLLSADSFSDFIRRRSALVAFVFMALFSVVRFILFIHTFRVDGHRYRLPGAIRPFSQSCASDETIRLQPITSPTQLLAQRKLEVHALVFFAMALEVPVYYLGFLDIKREDRLPLFYPMHMFSAFFIFCAFALLLNILVKFVDLERRTKALRWALVVVGIAYLPVCIYAGVACTSATSLMAFLPTEAFHVFGWFTVANLFLISASFLGVGVMLHRRVWGVLRPVAGEQNSHFWVMICRLNFVTLCCTLCFFIQGIMMSKLMDLSPVAKHEKFNVSLWQWLMYEQWVPMIVPCIALLYLWRDSRNAGPPAIERSSYRAVDNTQEGQAVAL